MGTTSLIMENIYKGVPITESKSDYIYDFNNVKFENGIKEFTRYNLPLNESTYDPYKINLGFIKRLHEAVTVIRSAPIEVNELDDNIICMSAKNVVINEFPVKKVEDVLITDAGDFTPTGLWAFCFMRNYGDFYFKAKIEEILFKLKYKPTRIGHKDVYMQETSSKNRMLTNIVRGKDFNYNGEVFFWRD